MILDSTTRLNQTPRTPNFLVIGALIYIFVMTVQGIIWSLRDPIASTFKINYSVSFWSTNFFQLFIALTQTYLLRTAIWKKIHAEQFNPTHQVIKLVVLCILTVVVSFVLNYLAEWYIDKVNKGQPFIYPKADYDALRLYGTLFNYFKISLVIWILSIKHA